VSTFNEPISDERRQFDSDTPAPVQIHTHQSAASLRVWSDDIVSYRSFHKPRLSPSIAGYIANTNVYYRYVPVSSIYYSFRRTEPQLV